MPAVPKWARGRELAESAAGRRVAAQAGCEACHRIGDAGNPGPGSSVTHVGSWLTERQIRGVLLRPKRSMPSFRGIPKRKLTALVALLALLR